jgi:uncharacterized protein with PIN domain
MTENIDMLALCHQAPFCAGIMRLVCDDHLGKLARDLRVLGFDTLWIESGSDARIVEACAAGRVFITGDRSWSEKTLPGRKLILSESDPRQQLSRVLRDLDLTIDSRLLFSRCSVCNTLTQAVAKEDVLMRLPPHVRKTQELFRLCPGCDRIYWQGTHVEALRRRLTGWGVLESEP